MKELLDVLITKFFYFLSKFIRWLYGQDPKRKHIVVSFEKGTLKVTVTEHQQLIKEFKKEIEVYQKKNTPRKTIEKALRMAMDGCTFVAFQERKDEGKFLQFWTNWGSLEHDFPMSKQNGLLPYRLEIIGLLANLEFIKKSLLESKFKDFPGYKHHFVTYKSDDFWKINANFHKNYELCTKYTYLALKKILKVDPKKIEIVFG